MTAKIAAATIAKAGVDKDKKWRRSIDSSSVFVVVGVDVVVVDVSGSCECCGVVVTDGLVDGSG